MECNFVLTDAIELLGRTPEILRIWLSGLPEAWIAATEGPETWSSYDIVGHFIHGEKTDWIPRARHILSSDSAIPFEPFDRFAQFDTSKGKSLNLLLAEFQTLRAENLMELCSLKLGDAELEMKGEHPEFGTVTLRQLLAAWVAHDMSHLAHVARVMGRRYKEDSGPWSQYLPILNDRIATYGELDKLGG